MFFCVCGCNRLSLLSNNRLHLRRKPQLKLTMCRATQVDMRQPRKNPFGFAHSFVSSENVNWNCGCQLKIKQLKKGVTSWWITSFLSWLELKAGEFLPSINWPVCAFLLYASTSYFGFKIVLTLSGKVQTLRFRIKFVLHVILVLSIKEMES